MSQTHYNRKRKQGEHLRYEDRVLLEHYVRENDARPRMRKWSQRRIAHEVGISPATTSRELKRGEVELKRSDLSVYKSYSAVVAQIDCEAKWKGRGPGLKIGKDHAFAEYVERQILEKKYSPDAIVMELKREGNPFQTSVCTRTLYHYIEIGVFQTVSRDNLRRHGEKPKREYSRVRRAYRGDGKSIIDRPESAETRAEPGHWEMDCVVSGKGKGRACLLTMVDRMTREAKLFKLPSQTQSEVLKVFDDLERRLGKRKFVRTFRTVTVDNGSEFYHWRSLERSVRGKGTRTAIYYAHPYSSWERGSNEQFNSMVRFFIPKGSSIAKRSRREIQGIEYWINNYPRRILGGDSAKTASARAEAV